MGRSRRAHVSLLLLALSCCTAVDPAADGRAAAFAPEAVPAAWWPHRFTAELDRIAAAMPRQEPGRHVAAALPFGEGILRLVRPADAGGRLLEPDAPPLLEFVSFRSGGAPEAGPAQSLELLDPTGPGAGLAVVCTGAGGAPEAVPALADALRARGFAVLRLELTSFVRPAVRVPLAAGLEEAGRTVARAVDDRLAEAVYAVEAVLAYVAARRPERTVEPLVLVGLGAGAAAIPPLAARLPPGSVSAAVLAGSAVHLLAVARDGQLPATGIELVPPPEGLDDEARRWLDDLYLAESRLDPYHTVRFLGRTPVLLLHARFDEVIPAWHGELLYERLGRPARVVVAGDHDDLEQEVLERVDWIADWIAAALRP